MIVSLLTVKGASWSNSLVHKQGWSKVRPICGDRVENMSSGRNIYSIVCILILPEHRPHSFWACRCLMQLLPVSFRHKFFPKCKPFTLDIVLLIVCSDNFPQYAAATVSTTVEASVDESIQFVGGHEVSHRTLESEIHYKPLLK